MDSLRVESYLTSVASRLSLRAYGKPIIHSPQGAGKPENEGFDAFLPLIDSGISLYVWSSAKFFSVVLFTCKAFDSNTAVSFTKEYFNANEIEHTSF